ncbi:MAG: TonB family protein [Deltaproteobacteria bacterium]|nr:TonB family protein [Deltaproteobacteria bacterium]
MAAGALHGETGGYRVPVSAFVSAILHVALLLALAASSIELTHPPDQRIIPLTIRAPAPPAPPGPITGAAVVGPLEPVGPREPVKPQPVPEPVVQPKPDRAKIAAKPKPSIAVAKAKPTAATAPPAAPVADRAHPASDTAAASAGGGVAGGVVGGRPGGRRGVGGDDLFTLDQVAVAPKLIDKVVPVYPALARARGQEGAVQVRAIINRSGGVEDDSVRIVASQPPFDSPAIDAVKRWHYSPGKDESGNAVRVLLTVSVRFQLR